MIETEDSLFRHKRRRILVPVQTDNYIHEHRQNHVLYMCVMSILVVIKFQGPFLRH